MLDDSSPDPIVVTVVPPDTNVVDETPETVVDEVPTVLLIVLLLVVLLLIVLLLVLLLLVLLLSVTLVAVSTYAS